MSDKVVPVVKADEGEEEEAADLVDPQEELREKCSHQPQAAQQFAKLQACNDRVNSRPETTETCVEELIDYLHVLDHCVTHDLFKRLK